ncbi:cytochrome P450 [Phanerochaete sordida]|uniref:Cytochrome P450 n=1 Tax=Phanerochaete sordida TaxID=48140 RepID=A0A9P3GMY2_9APHY|nr:cytochrome P450 [Phanerochaete sordida]
MNPLLYVCAALVVWLGFRWYRWVTRLSIGYIRGPPVRSALLGNVRDLSFQENVGDLDFKYAEEYGTAWRMQYALGSKVLMIADPKAIQHVFHKSGYLYPKTIQARVNAYIVAGKNMLWAPTGECHSRHKKVIAPAFTAPQLRSYLPFFRKASGKVCQLWKDQILAHAPGGATIQVNRWMARAALDIIGETAFDFDFGALENSENELSKVYHNMFVDSALHPPPASALFQALFDYLPWRVLEHVRRLPLRDVARLQRTVRVFDRYAARLLAHKAAHADTHARDAMSIFVRANASADPRTRLSDEEMVAQMCALTFAGHETTANTTTWLLWELARHPQAQVRLRAEVCAKRVEVNARGVADFGAEDLDGMGFLQAVIKETLRYHCIVYHLNRVASEDDVIPLAYPITTDTGDIISEIPVAAGQVVMPNIAVYNRLPEVWGADADEWNPMRFIDGKVNPQVQVGMYANLFTFSGGVRGCIGWRFALMEMQAIITDLVENFQFSIPEDKPEIIRVPANLMAPMIKGRLDEGAQMPLYVVAL